MPTRYIPTDRHCLLLPPCILWTESGDRPVFYCRRTSAYTRPAYCLFSCMAWKPGRSCWKIYGGSRPSICIASVWSLEYAGTILSETPRSSPPPIFPVSRTLSPRGETHCSVTWWDLMIILRLIVHCPRSRQLEPVPASTPAGVDTRLPALLDGTPFGIHAKWSKASHCGHTRLTQRTSAVYVIWWSWCNVRDIQHTLCSPQ